MRTLLDICWVLVPLAFGVTWIVTSMQDRHAGYLVAGIAMVWVSGAMAALTFAERDFAERERRKRNENHRENDLPDGPC